VPNTTKRPESRDSAVRVRLVFWRRSRGDDGRRRYSRKKEPGAISTCAVYHSYPMVECAKGHSAGRTVEETRRWRNVGKHYVGHGR
jgi:hypothetical protein